jgi:hypothetical protein
MHEALRIIAFTTGCTPEQAQAAVAALVEQGWSAPSAVSSASADTEIGVAVVPSQLADVAPLTPVIESLQSSI